MADFLEIRLSDEVAIGFHSDTAYSTGVTTMENGAEYRNIEWDDAERRYNADYSRFTPEQYDDLLATFHVVYGSGHGFRFKDWFDYRVVNGLQGATPAGSSPLQLIKVYTKGGETNTRVITKPVAGTLVVEQFIAGVWTAVPGTFSTVTGLFTPTSAWGVGAIRATFEFDVPVRFTSDRLPSTYTNFAAISVDVELKEIDPFA